jgi:sulfate transport system permease protein
VTLPQIKWGLLYGIILCNARAVGEFGAVAVVSGHIAGRTETIPLRVEKLFQEYDTPGSFALASLLTLLALVTLVLKAVLERKAHAERLPENVAEAGEPVVAKPQANEETEAVPQRRPSPEVRELARIES